MWTDCSFDVYSIFSLFFLWWHSSRFLFERGRALFRWFEIKHYLLKFVANLTSHAVCMRYFHRDWWMKDLAAELLKKNEKTRKFSSIPVNLSVDAWSGSIITLSSNSNKKRDNICDNFIDSTALDKVVEVRFRSRSFLRIHLSRIKWIASSNRVNDLLGI